MDNDSMDGSHARRCAKSLNAPSPDTASRRRRPRWTRTPFVSPRQPWNVLWPLVLVQWLFLLLMMRRLEHNAWLFAQDGAGTYSYSTAWSFAHGHLPPALVGYGWPLLTTPIAGIAGADYLDGLPALVLLQTLVLLPLGLLAVYGVASRIGGRSLGYLTAACWVLIPYLAIALSTAAYRQAYEQQLMPQALGLIGAGGLPGMVCLLVGAYFAISSLDTSDNVHAAIAGLFAGFAIAFDPANTLFLAAPAVGYALARRGRTALAFAVALVPALATVALWQYRGLGHVPHIHAAIDPHRLALLAQGFRGAFYSDRLFEAAFVAGVIGLARRSPSKSAFVAAWFLPYLLVRGSAAGTDFGTGSWFGALMPAFPAFVISLCSIPLLVTRLGERLARAPVVDHPPRLTRGDPRLVAAGIALAALPIVIVCALPIQKKPILVADADDRALVPVTRTFQPVTGTRPGTVYLQWPAAKKPAGATAFYEIFRSPGSVPGGIVCDRGEGATRCVLAMQRLGSTPGLAYSDIAPPVPAGKWTYRIGLAANWQKDPSAGGLVLLSPPVDVTVPEG
jgi:hypothetical protein